MSPYIVCFDTETTGLDVQRDHVIQLSLVKFDTQTWQEVEARDWYICPECDFTIPAEAEAVHHISKQMLLSEGVRLRDVWPVVQEMIRDCDILSYNGNGYDAPILYYNCARAGISLDLTGRVWYDALLIERQRVFGQTDENGERLRCNLTAAHTRYYGHPFDGAHNSLADVRATIAVFRAQVEADGWEAMHRPEFDYISLDGFLTKRGDHLVMSSGKYKGLTISQVQLRDASYLDWVLTKCAPQTRQAIMAARAPQRPPKKAKKTTPGQLTLGLWD